MGATEDLGGVVEEVGKHGRLLRALDKAREEVAAAAGALEDARAALEEREQHFLGLCLAEGVALDDEDGPLSECPICLLPEPLDGDQYTELVRQVNKAQTIKRNKVRAEHRIYLECVKGGCW